MNYFSLTRRIHGVPEDIHHDWDIDEDLFARRIALALRRAPQPQIERVHRKQYWPCSTSISRVSSSVARCILGDKKGSPITNEPQYLN